MRTTSAVVGLLAALVVSWTAAASPLPESGELSCERKALGGCTFTDAASGLQFQWPNDWPVRRLKLVTETGPAARARQRDARRWISLEYLPDDPAQPEVPLFRIAVLSRSDWLVQASQPTPPAAVEVATGPEHVAVASLEPANPYPPGSRDADIFDALTLSFAEISRIVRLPPAQQGAYDHAIRSHEQQDR